MQATPPLKLCERAWVRATWQLEDVGRVPEATNTLVVVDAHAKVVVTTSARHLQQLKDHRGRVRRVVPAQVLLLHLRSHHQHKPRPRTHPLKRYNADNKAARVVS